MGRPQANRRIGGSAPSPNNVPPTWVTWLLVVAIFVILFGAVALGISRIRQDRVGLPADEAPRARIGGMELVQNQPADGGQQPVATIPAVVVTQEGTELGSGNENASVEQGAAVSDDVVAGAGAPEYVADSGEPTPLPTEGTEMAEHFAGKLALAPTATDLPVPPTSTSAEPQTSEPAEQQSVEAVDGSQTGVLFRLTPVATATPIPKREQSTTPAVGSHRALGASATGINSASATLESTELAADRETMTVSPTSTASATPTATNAPTATATLAPTETPAPTATFTHTPTMTSTATPTSTATQTDRPTSTSTSTATVTSTISNTPTAAPTVTPTATSSATATESPTLTATSTATAIFTVTPTVTSTATATRTETQMPTATSTASPTHTATVTPTVTPTMTSTLTATATATVTATGTETPTSTPSATPIPTLAPTATGTPTATSTAMPTRFPTRTSRRIAVPTAQRTPMQLLLPNPEQFAIGNIVVGQQSQIVLRSDATQLSEPVRTFGGGKLFEILDPEGSPISYPVIADGTAWIRVRTLDGFVGWIDIAAVMLDNIDDAGSDETASD